MKPKPGHLSERDLILAADREVSARRGRPAEEHLEMCRTCRARMLSLQEAIGEFVRSMRAEQARGQLV